MGNDFQYINSLESDIVISVIMPVYNTAGYLPIALKNIIEDQFGAYPSRRWELIIIDDGSTDNSFEQAKALLAERGHGSVTLLHTENRGVSAARNLGLKKARGKYVYFMDSDDIMLRGALPALCEEADEAGADVVKFVYRDIDPAAYDVLKANVPDANLVADDFTRHSAADYINRTNGLTGPPSHHATWTTVYRRSFLEANNLQFSEGVAVGEDIIMTWQAMLCNPTVLYADRALYLYHHRPGSALQSADTAHLRRLSRAYVSYLTTMLRIRDRIRENGLDTANVGRGLDDNYRYGYNRALASMVLADEPLGAIYRAMREINRSGGDVHPGRPRFNRDQRRAANFSRKLRRWLTAYPIAVLVCTLKRLNG